MASLAPGAVFAGLEESDVALSSMTAVQLRRQLITEKHNSPVPQKTYAAARSTRADADLAAVTAERKDDRCEARTYTGGVEKCVFINKIERNPNK